MRPLLISALLLAAATGCRGEVDNDDDGIPDWADCNDEDASIGPDVEETCNGVDDNCDGLVDNAATDATLFYADADGDGAGNASSSTLACEAPAGAVTTADDCDDADASVFPSATEDDCTDPKDYNCDGSVGFADADADGFPACEDCDDTAGAISPNGVEICDGVDNNCDGATDEAGAVGGTTWYADTDADGFGDADSTITACERPDGYVANDRDCDDAAVGTNPGAAELCNDVDDDCDGNIDEDATDTTTWYADTDGDGAAGSQFSLKACDQPEGYLASATDCDDLDPASNPSATELCDGNDNNCDGQLPADESDADSDGHLACADDCDDTDGGISPDASEVCDGVDNDCNERVDDNATDLKTFFVDIDGDGYGGALTAEGCEAKSGWYESSDDCNDSNADINPGAGEICDGLDQDCSGAADEEFDADGDGFAGCFNDCDDDNADISPGALEVCDDADVDENCNGVADNDDPDVSNGTEYFVDDDGDDYGTDEVVASCEQLSGMATEDGDCDDTAADVNPGEEDLCDNGVDNDCDPSTDDDPNIACDKVVFTTSEVTNGNIGGLAGADALCQDLADNAGLGGTFKAWLSDSTGSPSTRFTQSDTAYVLVDGTPIADNWADLVNGIAAPIMLTELGTVPPKGNTGCGGPGNYTVWSNTRNNGTLGNANSSCSNWTATSGGSAWGRTNFASSWSAWCSGGACSWESPIYCFQQ